MARPTPSRRRGQDWPARLTLFLAGRMATPFAWGTQDCASFACDAVVAMIGVDPMAKWRGTYATEVEAAAIIESAGGLEVLMRSGADAVGLRECNPRFVQRGDIALVEIGNDLMMAVVLVGKVAVAGLDRVQFAPTSAIVRAWAI